MKSDESALSIVPSNLSSRLSLSTTKTGRNDDIGCDSSLVYRRLSFEDELVTAGVYKRNYRNPRLQSRRERNSDPDYETVIFSQDEHPGKEIVQLEPRRFSGGINTSEISAKTAKKNAEENSKYQAIGSIEVSRTFSVSSEEIDNNLKFCVSSSISGRVGYFDVRLVQNQAHGFSLLASASYVNLVMACGRGDHDSVKLQLAVASSKTSEHLEGPFFSGAYLSGSLHFCPINATISNGHVEVMKTLLQFAEQKTNLVQVVEKVIGGTEIDHWRPLHVATMKGNLRMVNLLLLKGASVFSKTGLGIQAIHLAARIGSMELLMALIDAGADLNCADLDGRQPIHYISESQDRPDIILYLAERGADIDGSLRSDGSTPRDLAYKKNHFGNYEVLGVLASRTNRFFEPVIESILDSAIRHNSTPLVEALLKRGVSPNCCRLDGGSGLHTFVLRFQANAPHNTEILRFLLHSTDLLTKDVNGRTIMDSLFQFLIGEDTTSRTDLAVLFLKNLPEHKVMERRVLRSMIRGKEVRYQERDLENDPLASRKRLPISPPLMTANSLGWFVEEGRGEGKNFIANTNRIPIISPPLMIKNSLGWNLSGLELEKPR